MQCLNKAYLLIGGNVGDVFFHFQRATDLLNSECGNIVKASAVYKTAAWGITDQPAFLNQALLLETSLSAAALLPKLLAIEEKMGRKRMIKYGPRLIDIDILLYNDEVHHTETLTTPHPELQNRMFALIPLAEIAGEEMHPVFNKPIQQLLEECSDDLRVEKL